MKSVAVYSLKGGVGKTTTAVNLSYLAARSGRRTLLWDLDSQAAAGYYLRVRAHGTGRAQRLVEGKVDLNEQIQPTAFEGLDLLPADRSYRHLDIALDRAKKSRSRLTRLIRPLAARYDYLIFDAPPGLTLLSENLFRAADALLIPVLPAPLSLRALEQVQEQLCRNVPDPPAVWPFFSMVDLRKRLHRETCDGANRPAGFLQTTLPYTTTIEQMSLHRAPLPSYDARSRGSRAYRALWHEVRARLESTI